MNQVDISLTTVQGVLSGLLAFTTALLPSYPKFATSALCILGAAKIGIGAMQKDAGVQLATVPGKNEPVNVAAHETPDDPKAKPVA